MICFQHGRLCHHIVQGPCGTCLQAQGYVLISDFVYERDAHGKTYGWGVAEYSTPEKFFGEKFKSAVYRRTPEESCERVVKQLKKILPKAGEEEIRKLLK